MKSIPLLIILALFPAFSSFAQTPGWAWAKGNSTAGAGTGTTTDAAGNIYVVSNGNSSIWVSKYNSSGTIVWTQQNPMVGNSMWVSGIALDHSGNLVVSGEYQGMITFGTTVLHSGTIHLILVKYTTAGQLMWAKDIGGGDVFLGLSVDAKNNIYFAGTYSNVDTIGGFPLQAVTNPSMMLNNGVFTLKADSNGNVLWAKSAKYFSYMEGQSSAMDTSGNIYVTGDFSGTAVVGNDTLHASASDNFLIKYDNNGNVLWAKSQGDTMQSNAQAIRTDLSGNVYVLGYSFANGYTGDMFLRKFDANGNYLWKKIISKSVPEAYALVCDDAGNVYIGGECRDSTLFDGLAADIGFTMAGGSHKVPLFGAFVAKYDGQGNAKWVKGASDGVIYNLSIDQQHNVIATGYTTKTAKFDADTLLACNNTAAGCFVLAKIGLTTSVSNGPAAAQGLFSVFPNPASGVVNVTGIPAYFTRLSICDQLGKNVLDLPLKDGVGRCQLSVAQFATGLYFIRLSGANLVPQVQKMEVIH